MYAWLYTYPISFQVTCGMDMQEYIDTEARDTPNARLFHIGW